MGKKLNCASSHNQKKGKNKFKNKNQPELSELYRSLTTKELKKQTSRLVEGWRQEAGAERMPGKVAAGGAGGPTFECR